MKSMEDVALKNLPKKVAEEVKSCLVVNGAVPITQKLLEQTIGNLIQTPLLEIRQTVRATDPSPPSPRTDIEFPVYTWGGRMHIVPYGYVLPKYKVSIMWTLYSSGLPAEGIAPLKNLWSFDQLKPGDSVSWSEAKRLLSASLS